jgi:hypothetical protein
MRLWLSDRVFLDGRAGYASSHHGECTSGGDPCTTHGFGFWGGLGVEIVHDIHYGLELHGGSGAGMLGGGIGASFY